MYPKLFYPFPLGMNAHWTILICSQTPNQQLRTKMCRNHKQIKREANVTQYLHFQYFQYFVYVIMFWPHWHRYYPDLHMLEHNPESLIKAEFVQWNKKGYTGWMSTYMYVKDIYVFVA